MADKMTSTATSKQIMLAAKRPAPTKSYSPVAHKDVIDMTMEALDKAGLSVVNEVYKTARDGRQAGGNFMINNGDPEMQIKFGFVNSYDKSIPLGFAVGSNIIVCTNGMVEGDMGRFKRKHTGTILTEFQEDLGMYINKAGEIFETLKKDRERMKEIEITKRTMAELVGRMFVEEDIITATQIGILKREIETPTFDYKADGSLWQFYNHTTCALKESNVQMEYKQHANLHNFIKTTYSKEFADLIS